MDTVVAAVRCRPMTKSELDNNLHQAVDIVTGSKQVIVSGERAFTFNHAYSEGSAQEQIYNDLVNPVVERVMKGFNACVMAYGQTGSGKTYTMGTKAKASTPGVVQKALQKVFSCNFNAEIHVSFLEVYKEEVLDLLAPVKKKMQVVDFKPVGLTLVKTATVESALNVMEKGLGNRHVGATNANLHSSRSHAVFTIYFTRKSDDGECTSKLYLVDLAGSESVSAVTGDTRKEGVMINKGLLQLGIVMSALSSSSQDHVPYRSSVLTAILKDTLNPQNFVVLITCISPLNIDASITINSLQFASRIGSIKCNPEAGLIIKQRAPVTTPFKIPSSYNQRVNTTIATPGSYTKTHRSALRPLNNTFASPRTPGVQERKKQFCPTSTPLQNFVKPLFTDPTPISKSNISRSVKRRSSSEWDPLNISTSTVIDSTADKIKLQAEGNQTGFIQNSGNEKWFRSLIADVIREELKSHTFMSQTTRDEGPSPPKQPRRSCRLSKARLEKSSFFEHETDATILSSSPNLTVSSVRRSTRLSVAPRPIYYPKTSTCNSSLSAPALKQTKKAARFSIRFSTLPTVSPDDAQKQLNGVVLDILRSGNLKKLQSLPTVGPKTAIIISNHRLVHGPIESFKDLENVHGLTANFLKRFLWANHVVLDN